MIFAAIAAMLSAIRLRGQATLSLEEIADRGSEGVILIRLVCGPPGLAVDGEHPDGFEESKDLEARGWETPARRPISLPLRFSRFPSANTTRRILTWLRLRKSSSRPPSPGGRDMLSPGGGPRIASRRLSISEISSGLS
jgi:hypothetical protein